MSLIFSKVVFIDDDAIQNYLNGYSIKKLFKPATIEMLSFTDSEEGFRCITESCMDKNNPVAIFLDINMPVLSGWDILEKLDEMPPEDIEHLAIYLLSSSVDPADMKKATTIRSLTSFVVKPLNAKLNTIFADTLAHYKAASAVPR